MEIRKATKEDMQLLMSLYKEAREFMASTGNPDQWGIDKYPSEDILRNDISRGNLYAVTENEEIIGSFAFILGEDPTYKVITDGYWLTDGPYGTIHRIASRISAHGVAKFVFDYCRETKGIVSLRIDTYKENKVMQHVVSKYGFAYCGTIYTLGGGPRDRMAYELVLKSDN